MNTFPDPAEWVNAVTIPTIRMVASTLRIPLPSRGIKAQLAQALKEGIDAHYGDVLPQIRIMVAASVPIGTPLAALMLGALVAIGVASEQQRPQRVVAASGSSTSRAPRQRAVQIVPERVVNLLLQEPNSLPIRVAGLLEALGPDNLHYGKVPASVAVGSLDLNSAALSRLQQYVPTRFEANSNLLASALPYIQAFRACLPTIHEYCRALMRSEAPPLPTLPNVSTISVHYDIGREPKVAGGFPRLEVEIGVFRFTHPPFGIVLSAESVQWSISSIDGVSPEKYQEELSRPLSFSAARQLAYLLSQSEVPVHVSSLLTSPYQVPLLEIKKYLLNYVSLAANLQAKTNEFPVRHLRTGAAHRVFRYLKEHPELAATMQVSRTGNLPYCIEDYLPDSTWNALPPSIRAYAEPIVPAADYSTRLPDEEARQLLQIFDVAPVPGRTNQEVLREYFELAPDLLHSLCGRDPLEFVGTNALPQMILYLALMGMDPRKYIYPPDELTLVHTMVLANAGGIGVEATEAVPLAMEFLQHYLPRRNRELMDNVGAILGVPSTGLLTADQITTIFSRGYILPLPLEKVHLERYQKWERYSQEKKQLLATMYGFPVSRMQAFVRMKEPDLAIEDYLAYLTAETVEASVAALGMLPPPSVNRLHYAMTTLVAYREVFTRGGANLQVPPVQLYPKLTDSEIVAAVGARYPYRSRQELITNGVALRNGRHTFFLPTKRQYRNAHTADYVGETADPSLFLLAYGTLDNYVGYQLTDLIAGFNSHGEDNSTYSYRIPNIGAPGYTPLSLENVSALEQLLQHLFESLSQEAVEGERSDRETARALQEVIREVHRHSRGADLYQKEIFQRFLLFSAEVQDLIRRYLEQLFYCGMYMRRWLGPPNPYPHSESETKRGDFNSDLEVVPQIGHLGAIYEQIGQLSNPAYLFIADLRVYQDGPHGEARASLSDRKVVDLLRGLISGSSCIRVSSTYVLGTATGYTKLFFDVTFPGYNPHRIDLIS